MFILGEVINVINNLTRFRYKHNLAIDHLVGSVSDHVGLVVEPPFPIVWIVATFH